MNKMVASKYPCYRILKLVCNETYASAGSSNRSIVPLQRIEK